MRRWILGRICLLASLLVAISIPSASRSPGPKKPARPSRTSDQADRAESGSSVAVTVQVAPAAMRPESFRLDQNHPNPFGNSTQIRFGCPRPEHVNLTIYSASGERVVTLHDGTMPAGFHSIPWDGRDGRGHEMSSGIYFCRMTAGNYGRTRKLLLLR